LVSWWCCFSVASQHACICFGAMLWLITLARVVRQLPTPVVLKAPLDRVAALKGASCIQIAIDVSSPWYSTSASALSTM
jgi:hypothetical protein